jgi:hypothetical protein
MQYNMACFLGLLFEANVAEYELDVYAFISNTKYKYILIKNEPHNVLKNLGAII